MAYLELVPLGTDLGEPFAANPTFIKDSGKMFFCLL